jgi:hypothetical protein
VAEEHRGRSEALKSGLAVKSGGSRTSGSSAARRTGAALDVLRSATEPMTVTEIAATAVKALGVEDADARAVN